eukprot:29307-Pelagococcus_subviridis.AAC.15
MSVRISPIPSIAEGHTFSRGRGAASRSRARRATAPRALRPRARSRPLTPRRSNARAGSEGESRRAPGDLSGRH